MGPPWAHHGPQGSKTEAKIRSKINKKVAILENVEKLKKTTRPVHNRYFATFEPLLLEPFGDQNPTPNSVSPRLLQKHTQSGNRGHTYCFVVDFGPILGPNLVPQGGVAKIPFS